MGEFSRQLEEVAILLARAGGAVGEGEGAAEQGGVISGDNPTHYNAGNPFRLWVIQVVIIIAMTQFLALGLSRIRQPRVIAEVVGGVLLGPTVMGRIPGFLPTIFPDAAMPLLSLTATIGLILFLFLVGLEIDTRMIRRNVKASFTVSIAGLLIPLGLGAALGVGLYREFIDPSVNFGYFLLFCAVAIGITAFPVLCRILTELKLLDTQVGVVVLSAGIGNDVIGWVLLALTVALVNASTGLTALWVLLVCVGYCIFLLYPVRWGFVWLAKRTGSLEQGTPTTFMMTVTLLVVFISAFFTDIIGVHAIFGGFLAGLIVPHENGFAIALVEKIEDLVSILFLPLYFTLSGLRTNLGLLNDGVAWGYTILICLVAFASKFLACSVAALAFGFQWREAGAIGSLMSCKGLVELIVLNIGLQAGVLNQKTFSMFVVHALVLTFITTPLTLAFYPSKYRSIGASKAGGDKKDGGDEEGSTGEPKVAPSEDDFKSRFALLLEKIEELPAAMTLSQLLQPAPSATSSTLSLPPSTSSETRIVVEDTPAAPSSPASRPSQAVTVDALRLIELTNRTSAVFRSTEAETLMYNDPVISVYRAFGQLNQLRVSASLEIVNFEEFAEAVKEHVEGARSEMLLIPWSRGTTSVVDDESGLGSPGALHGEGGRRGARNPFDGVFHKTTTMDQTSSVVHSEFIRSVFLRCPCDVALFVERGTAVSATLSPKQHLFLPFFGGPDDRLALKFLVQVCGTGGGRTSATVVWVRRVEEEVSPVSSSGELDAKKAGGAAPLMSPTLSSGHHLTVAGADTVYAAHSTQTRLASDTADNLIWEKYTNAEQVSTLPSHVSAALSRITFSTENTTTPLHKVVELASAEAERVVRKGERTLIVVAGRSRRLAVESLGKELKEIVSEAAHTHVHNPTTSAPGQDSAVPPVLSPISPVSLSGMMGSLSAAAGLGNQSQRGDGHHAPRMGSSVPKTLGDVGAALVARGVEASLLVVQASAASGVAE